MSDRLQRVWAWLNEPLFKPRQRKPVAVNPISMYRVLRGLVGLMSGTRAEVRLLRKRYDEQREEDKMAIEELSKNVATLIQLAESHKAASDAAASAPPPPSDQPAIDALNQQVVNAIGQLSSVQGQVQTPPNPVTDPNAPVA